MGIHLHSRRKYHSVLHLHRSRPHNRSLHLQCAHSVHRQNRHPPTDRSQFRRQELHRHSFHLVDNVNNAMIEITLSPCFLFEYVQLLYDCFSKSGFVCIRNTFAKGQHTATLFLHIFYWLSSFCFAEGSSVYSYCILYSECTCRCIAIFLTFGTTEDHVWSEV